MFKLKPTIESVTSDLATLVDNLDSLAVTHQTASESADSEATKMLNAAKWHQLESKRALSIKSKIEALLS